jgi:holo-[acyl-carrier protein] synthase
MAIIGHGVDLVEIARIERMLADHGRHFLDRCFTPEEQAYCDHRPRRRVEHLAGRFAAKEAVLKVLGTGWSGGIAWTDIQITNQLSGQPIVELTGLCRKIAAERGIRAWHISISHIETHAIASAIGEG